MSGDVIVVLGAGFLPDGRPSQALKRRSRHAARLYHKGVAGTVLVSGGIDPRRTAVSEAAAMTAELADSGVPRAAIVLESEARNTDQNASLSGRLMAAHGWDRAILVTDREHMPRARLAFWYHGIATLARPVRGERIRPLSILREFVAALWYVAKYLARAVAGGTQRPVRGCAAKGRPMPERPGSGSRAER
jgi:uncharacterized SAM-binding protein YcdF (DUF218 family)